MIVRKPAVAGHFYPANPNELKQMVNRFLSDAQTINHIPKAIIAPHAGYIYSGPVAASAYASLNPIRHKIKRVILLGPAHRVYIRGLALSSATSFATPLGEIEIDQDAVNLISELPQVSLSDAAHREEHSLEVHLPFLQTLFRNFLLVPLVVGETSPQEVAEVLELLWGYEETLIVISSDLSHYHDYDTANKIDRMTTKAIENLQLEKIGSHQACGCMPLRGMLLIAREKNLQVETLDLRNSGDTAGSQDRVVGYGAYAISIK
jgi:AmmeMemoRadiSam system protein B